MLKKSQGVASFQEWIKKLKAVEEAICTDEKFII
jgi:hypothetical protein